MGMPYTDVNDFGVSIVQNTNIKRGDLYLYFKIRDIDVHKQTIKDMFPPIQN
jgi:hypothetical protein